jgi:hypothetical protein
MRMAAESLGVSGRGRRLPAFRDGGSGRNAVGQAEPFLWAASPLV